MITSILIVIGLNFFIDAIFEKFEIWDLIEEKGSKRSEFVFKLTSCRFCLHFHINWILIVLFGFLSELMQLFGFFSEVFGFFSELTPELFFLPFIASGLINLILKK